MTKTEWPKEVIISALISIIAAFLIYLPTLGFDFTNWDDHVYVYENPNIHSLGGDFFSWVATAVVHANWHPLTIISLALDYAVWELDPKGYHLTNALINAINAGLVAVVTFAFARYRSMQSAMPHGSHRGNAFVAAITAGLLFAVHPLHVESVAWISERKDVLSLFFFLLAVLAYVRHASLDGAGPRRYYILSIVFTALSLLSKPMAISTPFVLLILDYYPLSRLLEKAQIKKAIIEKLPYFALSALSALITLWAQEKGGAIRSLETLSISERLYTAFSAYFFYLYKLLVPIKLAPVYPYPDSVALINVKILALFIALAGVTFFTVYVLRKQKIFASAWLYYLVTLLPVIGIVQVGNQGAADRYTYMPGIAIFMLAGGVLAHTWGICNGRAKIMGTIAFLATIILLACLTVRQEAVWKNSLTLWTRQISLYPNASHMAFNLRGNELQRLGRTEEALDDYSTAISIDPLQADPYYNRAFLYQGRGEFEKAIDDYSKVLSINGAYFKAYMNRAISYAELGRLNEAIEDFTAAITIEPTVAEARRYRAVTYLNAGNMSGAISDYERLSIDGKAIGDDFYNLARAYDDLGEHATATEKLKVAATLGHGPSIEMLNKFKGE